MSPPISRFGIFVVIWAAVCVALLVGALNRDADHTVCIVLLFMWLCAMVVGIERIRFAVRRHQAREKMATIRRIIEDSDRGMA